VAREKRKTVKSQSGRLISRIAREYGIIGLPGKMESSNRKLAEGQARANAMHDDDEKNEMEKKIEEMLRKLKQVDPEQLREAFRERLDGELPEEIARAKADFAALFNFLSRPVGSYDYKELQRVQAEATRFVMYCGLRRTRLTIDADALDASPAGKFRALMRDIAASALDDVGSTWAFLERDPSEHTLQELERLQTLALAGVTVLAFGDLK